MVTQTTALLILFAVMCTDAVLKPLSPARTRGTNTYARQPHFPATTASTTRETTTTPPSTTTMTTTVDVEETQPIPQDSVFTTNATAPSTLLVLPQNESISRVLFWPLFDDVTVTLNLTVWQRNYTFNATTVLPQQWHSIDIRQPTDRNATAGLYLYTERRFIHLDYSRVLQMRVGSDNTTYWAFCPRAYLCSLVSPLRDEAHSSRDQADLLVALLVVVFLFIVVVLALIGVTCYRKSELFHIYAKPVDCLPHLPPPLPTPNKQPARPTKRLTHAEQIEGEKTVVNSDEVTFDDEYTKVADNLTINIVNHSALPAVTHDNNSKKRESINNIYGMI